MAKKQPVLFTFHKIREQGEQGDAEAWRAWLSFYGPLYLQLLNIYLPGDPEAGARLFEKLLERLGEDNFQRFRSASRQSEREFLTQVRALLLDLAASFAAEAPREADGPRTLDLEKLSQLLQDLPLAHQEILFFKLAGYTDATIEGMMRIAPRVAEKAFERLPPACVEAQNRKEDRCPWPAEWLTLLREARATKKENCAEPYQLLRIQDGQVSWYDKEPVEKHVGGCLWCLENWTALREVAFWRRVAAPIPAGQIERFLQALPLAAPSKKPLLRRVLGRS
jgi:hypothetical protein